MLYLFQREKEAFAKRDIFSSGKEGDPALAGLTGGIH